MMPHSSFVSPAGEPLDLVLYMKPTCPFCRKVLAAAGDLGFELAQRDVAADASARARLLEVGGKATVPCLFVDGKPLYESDAIVHFLREQVRRGDSSGGA